MAWLCSSLLVLPGFTYMPASAVGSAVNWVQLWQLESWTSVSKQSFILGFYSGYRVPREKGQKLQGLLRPRPWNLHVTSPHSICQSNSCDQPGLKRYRKRLLFPVEGCSPVTLQMELSPEMGGFCDYWIMYHRSQVLLIFIFFAATSISSNTNKRSNRYLLKWRRKKNLG